MVQDEQIKPLIGQLYTSAEEAWTRIEERVGLPLNQLLAIPQGEIAIAFVAPPEQRPGLVFLLDVHDRLPQAQKVLEKGEDFLLENGGTKAAERIDGHDAMVYTGSDGTSIYKAEREGTILIASTKELMQFALAGWNGNAEKTLADNDRFNSIMSRCAGAVDDPPQLTFFVDPIEIAKTALRNTPAATGLALIPVLGLNGVQGIGGSITLATGEFDDVSHFHVLLENPRSGVLELLAMGSGDTTPEPWVPADIISYNTLHWDVRQTFDKAAELYNSLASEGAFQAEVKTRLGDRLGVDFEQEIIPALDGRFTWTNWVAEKPVRLNSIANIVGVKLKDPQAFTATLNKMTEKYAENLEKKSFGGVTYWQVKMPERPPRPEGQGRARLRQPEPCFAIIGDYLVGSDSSAALDQAIITSTDPTRRLSAELDYKLIASKIKRQVGGDAPGMIQFNRPEEGMRFWYDMALAEDTQRRLERGAENNPVFRSLDKALKDNPLPPFSVLAKYFAPGGGMMVNDETGIHFMSFTLRRK